MKYKMADGSVLNGDQCDKEQVILHHCKRLMDEMENGTERKHMRKEIDCIVDIIDLPEMAEGRIIGMVHTAQVNFTRIVNP